MNGSRAGKFAALFLVGLGALAACVDPKGQFNEWLDRTSAERGVTPEGGVIEDDSGDQGDAVPEAEPYDANWDNSGTYYMTCYSKLGPNPDQTLPFYAVVTVKDGKLSFIDSPLLKTATNLDKSQTVGTPITVMDAPIGTDGSWSANVGTVQIPGASQRVSENDLTIEGVKFSGHITSPDRMCAELDGQVTSPINSSLASPGDICTWNRLADGAPLPTAKFGSVTFTGYPLAEYAHCP